ncbi:acetyl-CoA synthetase-like protein [Periconia macrospinosa]|uniref:Acetyl-CoA synthetase-like protein n=1 Tax=Periconia macrospinosa TaxID=97972 RepID=A0A2V1DN25_9PLEO|nr:acetyl-CoA synthetase-like protein [Periconia macrospinosa]
MTAACRLLYASNPRSFNLPERKKKIFGISLIPIPATIIIVIITAMSNTTHINKTSEADMDLLHLQNLQKSTINGHGINEDTRICVLDLVQKAIDQNPDGIAVDAWDGKIKYRELSIATHNIAAKLEGLGKGDFVALCVPRSKWTPIAMLAAMQTGAAFVHIDPTYPFARIAAICAACKITTAICLEETKDIMADHIQQTIGVDNGDLTAPMEVSQLPGLGGRNESPDTCYVVFTSGSSGTPKGVVVPHSAICASILAQGLEFQLSSSTRVLQFAPATFDASMFELITTLCFGSCCCIPSKTERENNLVEVLNQYRTDLVFLTPSLARTVEPGKVPLLRNLIVGGEAPDEALINNWLSEGKHISNVYGPSECAVSASVLHYNLETRVPAATIGRPLGGGLWVVDSDDHNVLVKPGEVGELLISGQIVTDGYFNDAIKTNAAFVPAPKWWRGSSSSGRLYKTGDLVKYGTSGLILYVGRKDSQVKVRGQRLEPGEVEHHLRRSSLVQEATACVPRKGICIITLRSLEGSMDITVNTIEPLPMVTGSTSAEETRQIQKELEKSLPPYMVPTQWLVFRSMPRSSSDKLDVRRIQTWIETADAQMLDSQQTEIQQPTTASEAILLNAWKRVLKDVNMGINDQFIRRGGDSILAMQVVSECRKRNLNVTVRSLLMPQSLAEIAQEACCKTVKTHDREEEKIGEPFELSPIQQLYFENDPEGANMCNQSISLSLKGDVEFDALQKAFVAVINRHSMLRVRFAREGQHWKQHITLDAEGSFVLKQHNIKSMAEKNKLVDESERIISIVRGPVLAADVFVAKDGERTMHLAAHHLLVDFVSWRIILDDLDVVLNGTLINVSQPSSMSFSQWTKIQYEYAQGIPAQPVLTPESEWFNFWNLSTEENTVSNSTESTFQLNEADSKALLRACNVPTASDPVDLLITAVLYSFHQTFSEERDIPQIFVEGHGREAWDASIDISGTVGWFTTIYPLILKNAGFNAEITDMVQNISISRRSLTLNGLDYFSSRYLSQEREARDFPMEILFNFGGSFTTLGQENTASTSKFEFICGENGLPFDERRTGRRLALFEITSIVKDGCFVFNFQHPRAMKRGEQVRQWFQNCKEALVRFAHELPLKPRQLHVADFPLLAGSIPHSASKTYLKSLARQLALRDLSVIEDIYPTSAIQRGILVSQSRQIHLYQLYITWDISATTVDVGKLRQAWQQIVEKNAILRTTFIDDVVGADTFHQVVLRAGSSAAWIEEAPTDVDIETLSRPTYSLAQPHHRLTLQRLSKDACKCRLDINHALVDGASLAIIVDQLQNAYAGTPIAKPPAYRQYVEYHQQKESSNAMHLDYWSNYLIDAVPCFLPGRTTPIPTRSKGLKTIHFEVLDRNLIETYCQKQGVTMSSLFQLAWALLLQAYTNQTTVTFGFLVSQRDMALPYLDNAVGPYINTIVRRIELDGESGCNQILRYLQDDLTRSLDHASSSLSDVLRAHPGGLYNTAISYQRYGADATASHELTFDRKTLFDPSEDMVALDVDDYGTRVDPSLTYWHSSMSDENARNIADTVASAIASLVRHHDAKLKDLSIISPQQVSKMNQLNVRALRAEQCLHDLVTQQAIHAPEAVAVESRDGSFTYAEIDDLSSRLAHFLIREHQIALEEKVLLCSEKTSLAVIIILGILKAGGVCVAIDPAQPLIRLHHIHKETEAKLAFTSEALYSKMSELELCAVTFTAQFLVDLPSGSLVTPTRKVQPENVAFIVYTSGSTGLPKGIMLEHGSLCASILAHASALRIDSTTRALQFASWSFDVSIEETFTTLSQGGCVCVPSEWDRKNDIAAFIRDFDVNWVDLVPGMARQLQPENIPSVHTMILGGERLPLDVARKWAPKVKLINVYGPAECCINATFDDDLNTSSDGSTIGRVIPSTNAWVVGIANHNVLMPIGGIGELVLSGPTVMRGYINDQGRTDAAIFTNPAWASSDFKQDRFYKTGDLVHLNGQGRIFLLGRKDAQRKLRGHRIDLEEIQQVISDNGYVRTCSVALPRSGTLKDQIVAVVVLKDAYDSSEDSSLRLLSNENIGIHRSQLQDIKCWVSERLPSLMVPTAWALVSHIPELASGKLNISLISRWLTELDDNTTEKIQETFQDTMIQPAKTKLEADLLAVWASVLNKPSETIGVNRTFVSLGGDSLAAMQIRSKAKAAGVVVTVENLLSGMTIADIAKNGESIIPTESEGFEHNETVSTPLSAIQRTYLSRATPNTLKRFNLATLLKVLRPVSIENLRKHLTLIVTRHGALRTRFAYENETWCQFSDILPENAFTLCAYKVKNEKELKAAIEGTQERVDILKGPGLAVCLIMQDSGENFLFLTAHHLIVDIVSWQIITDELQEAFQTGDITSAKPLSFNTWLKHTSIRKLNQGVNLDKWSTATQLSAPQDNLYGDVAEISFTLDAEITSSLLAVAQTTDRIEIVDLLLTGVITGYHQTFQEYPPAHFMRSTGDEKKLEDSDILFNYVGNQHLESISAHQFFSRMENQAVHSSSVAHDLRRPAQHELLAMVVNGELKIEIGYNCLMHEKKRIEAWCSNIREALINLTSIPMAKFESLTFADCELVQSDESSFELVLADAMKKANVPRSIIQDIYPCHPQQQGMLMSQTRNPDQYLTSSTWEITTKDGSMIDVESLCNAWENVVKKHDILRTYFVEGSVAAGTLFAQVVLKTVAPRMNILAPKASYDLAVSAVGEFTPLKSSSGPVLHQLVICQGGTRTVCRLDISHTIIDGASMHLILSQISLAYHSLNQDLLNRSKYKPLIRYWLETMPESSILQSLHFWKNQLDGVEPCHFPQMAIATEEKSTIEIVSIPLVEPERLRDASRKYGLTPFNIVQVAWSLVLRSFIQNDTVCFGYLASGRHRPISGIEDAIGPYFTMLICKMQFNRSSTLLECLHSAQKEFLESFEHQEVSLSSIHHAVGLRDGATLFNTLLTYQAFTDNEEVGSLIFHELSSHDPTEYSITLGVVDRPSGIEIGMEYVTSCLGRDQAHLVAEAVGQAIESIIRDPTELVSEISLVGPIQREFILDTNAIPPVIVDELLHEEISRLAAISPDAPAVQSWDGDLSRAELDQVSSDLASHLLSTGIVHKADQIIPLCFHKSKWAIVAVLAVLKAGGAVTFMPLDVSSAQIKTMADFADATTVLADISAIASVEAAGLQCLAVTPALFNNKLLTPPRTPTEPIKSTNLSFVVFTSGSTGTPKAVMHTHRSIAATAYSERILGINTAETRRLQFAGFSFDVAVTDIISTLRAGGCVCIPSEENRIHQLAATIEELNANAANLTPTVVRTIQPAEVPSMKNLLVGGEALSRDIIYAWSPHAHVVNSYGPAESGINGVCNFQVTPDRPANIGKAFPTMRIWLTDPGNLDLLAPVGGIGEIILEGAGVARGYLKDKDRSLSAFPSSPAFYQTLPSSLKGQGQLYATGDLARYAPDGTIEFLGRKNQETKLHGHRIDLQAVEDAVSTTLNDNSFVAAEVVDILDLGKRLVAFVSSRSHVHSASCTVIIDEDPSCFSDLREKLRSTLSKHSIPSAIVPVSSMPLTQSRKIQRKTLREINLSAFMRSRIGDTRGQNKRKPTSQQEILLQKLWAKAIGIDHDSIGLDDQFFDVGGDSVAAMTLAALARDVKLSLKTSLVFKQVTLQEMAKTLTEFSTDEAIAPFSLLRVNENDRSDIVALVALVCNVGNGLIEDIYPCTPLQEGLLALSGSGKDAYISTETIKLTPGIDISRLERAFNKVADAEQILRTRLVFVEGHGTLQVVIREEIKFSTERSPHSLAMTTGTGGTPLIWLGLSECKTTLTWVMHHALYDGFSRKLILDKIQACYEDEKAIMDIAPYSSYVRYTSDLKVLEEAKAFWRDRLSDAAAPTFPRLATTKQNAKPWTNSVLQRRLNLPRLLQGITAATLIQSAWAVTIAQHSDHGTEDVVFGMTVSGRDVSIANIDRVTGPCIATVPARVNVAKEAVAMEVLRAVQDDNITMMPHAHIGLQEITKLLPKEDAHLCGFKSSLVIQPAFLKEMGAEDVVFGTLVAKGEETEAHPFAIVAELGLGPDYIDCYIMFDNQIIDTTELDWILNHFEHWVEALGRILNQNDTVSTLDQLNTNSSAEISMMQKWNGPHPEVVNLCLHDLFSQTVSRQPHAIAVDSHEGKWTYKELDEISNVLARHLQSLKIGPEDIVAVCFGKSVFAIISILAIWKAGGAYVPLDPLQPVQRLRGLINQTQAKLVLAGTTKMAKSLENASEMSSVLVIDPTHMGLFTANAAPVQAMADAENTCFVLFTSGSTGLPKGVVMKHSTIATSIAVHTKSTNMQSVSRVLHYSSLTFDLSVLELYGALALGGCIVIPSDDERMSDIGGFMARSGVTWALLTPTTANAIPNPPESLRTLVLAGEAVTEDIPARWPPSVEVLSGYGPTEVSILCATVDIRREPLPNGLIGYSTSGKMWLVQPGNVESVVGLGEIGEIMVSSVMLSEGYFRNEALTRAAFKSRPQWLTDLVPQGPERVYLTGDLAVHLPNGELVYLGRADSQVKINGQRIELGEVEQQLIASGCAVGDVVVEACKIEAWNNKKVLVAFIRTGHSSTSVLADVGIDAEPSAIEKMRCIRTAVTLRLPRAWIPTIFVPINFIPRVVSGKTDRKALRSMIQASSVDQLSSLMSTTKHSHLDVSTENERALQQMWSSVLRIPPTQISAGDMFIDVGGDSVAAIRLSTLALQKGWSLRVAHILQHGSLQAMAKAMTPQEDKKQTKIAPFVLLHPSTDIRDLADLCGMKREEVEDAYPCTPLQAGIMAMSQSRSGTYVGSFVYKLHSSVTTTALQMAWNRVRARNPILRTRIIANDKDGYVQVVQKHEETFLSVHVMETIKTEQDRCQKNMLLGKELVYPAIFKSDYYTYLSLTIHHSSYDGWSLPLLMAELQQGLAGTLSESGAACFNEFVAFLQHDKQASIDFWKAQLLEAQPTSFPSIPDVTYESRTNANSISVVKCPRQSSIAGLTLPLILRTAWEVVLSRYTASDDVLFGAVLSGRNAPVANIESLPAPTFTTVPVHMRLRETPTLENLLNEIREQSTAMIPHEQLGLRTISQEFAKDTGMKLELNNLLLVQSLDQVDSGAETALMIDEQLSQTMSESYGLIVECIPEADIEGSVTVHMHYDNNLLSEQAIQWLTQHFREAIGWVCCAPKNSSLAEFDMASSVDHAAVKAWNQHCDPRQDSCIHWEIQQHSRIQPNAIALDATVGGQWTYHALEATSSRLAAHLSSKGILPRSYIPIMFEKGAWAVVAMLAVLKVGAAYVPLDPKDTYDRHQHIIHQTKATFVLASSNNALPQHTIQCLAVNAMEMETWRADCSFTSPATPHDIAYTLFTSGSTGLPKGVVMEHSSLATGAAAMREKFKLGPHSRVYNFSSFTFDASILDILIGLSSGATICLPSEAERLDDLSKSLKNFRASFVFLTPTMASLVEPDAASAMDMIVLGGEAVTEDALIHCRGAKNILAGYGPTETCILSASGSLRDVSRANIGRPMGAQLWVIDPLSPTSRPRLAAVGCTGELAISGNTLAREYLDNPEKTAATFIENVEWMADQPTQRLYRTGDRVRFEPDGTVIFLGRMDSQIKHNGRRLELGEIEYHVAAADQIEQACVIYPSHGPWQKNLTAVVELTENIGNTPSLSTDEKDSLSAVVVTPNEQTLARVHNELATKLPMYMIPHAWIVVRKMPRGSAAKIDRARISRWVSSASHDTYEKSLLPTVVRTASDRPLSPTEELIRQLWATVLNRPARHIATEVPFPQFSGDSVSAIQVASKARQAGIKISARDIMQSQTIRRLAIIADKAAAAHINTVQTQEARPTFIEDHQPFPLSPVQRMYFKHMAAEKTGPLDQNSQFNQSFLLQLSSELAHDRLETAIGAIVEQNPMLRARFQYDRDGNISQTISKDAVRSYNFYDLGQCTAIEANEYIRVKQNELNPITGPIFFAISMQIDGSILLLMSALHLVVDLVSWRVVARQLHQLLENKALPPPIPITCFHEWTILQEARTKIEDQPAFASHAPEMKFWGVAAEQNTYGHIAQTSFSLDDATSGQLLSQSNKALTSETIDSLIASLAISFTRTFSERATPTIYIEGHGRETWDDSIDIGQTVGWFTTMYPCAATLGATDSTVAAVRAVKDARVQTPGRGRPYFASRYSESNSNQEPHLMEILFNYGGGYGEFESESPEALIRMPKEELASQINNHCIGSNVRRPALVEIYAAVDHGNLELHFTWNNQMQHQSRLKQWIHFAKTVLEQTALDLLQASPQPTLSDLTNFDGNHDNLDAIISKTNTIMDGHPELEITDIYPATALQERMVKARRSGSQLFQVKQAYQFELKDSIEIVKPRISSAWQQILHKHSALRSVLIQDNRNRMFNVVFKEAYMPLTTLWVEAEELSLRLNKPTLHSPQLPTLELLLEEGSNTARVLLQISHTIFDASSLAVVMDELQAACDTFSSTTLTCSNEIVHKALSGHRVPNDIAYWQDLLRGAKPTNLPSRSGQQFQGMCTSEEVTIPYTRALRDLGLRYGTTMATTLQAAWALTLHHLLEKQTDISFGYFSSGRDHPIPGIETAVGLFMNLCVNRVHLDNRVTVEDLIRGIQDDFSRGLQHQIACLDVVDGDGSTGSADRHHPLFNTVFNFPKSSAATTTQDENSSTFCFESVGGTDPMDFAILVRVKDVNDCAEGNGGAISVSLEYWPDRTEKQLVKKAGEIFAKSTKFIAAAGAHDVVTELL